METRKLADHMFVSDTDGSLHDTRKKDWHKKPLRTNYSRHHNQVDTIQDLKATIRAGEYAWPGGYQLAFITDDGGVLCFDCVKKELSSIMWSIKNRCNDGWLVSGLMDVDNMDHDTDCLCDHCGDILVLATISDSQDDITDTIDDNQDSFETALHQKVYE